MTSLSETRTVLLAQHEEIRGVIGAALRAFSVEPPDGPALRQALDQLVVLLGQHNAAEEEALRSLLPRLDAFGEVRKDVMLSDHVAEHQDLLKTLVMAGDLADKQALSERFDRLLGHMEHEENLVLKESLFKDWG